MSTVSEIPENSGEICKDFVKDPRLIILHDLYRQRAALDAEIFAMIRMLCPDEPRLS